ncbi:MAG TPA: MarR family transcriptional regulator [Burkholderiales bacterium]|nr:MarR family transcriptional regulator [Burkholderiales bacterium]
MPFRKAEAITRRIRACCNRLDAIEDELRQEAGITAAMRAVLGELHEHGAQTVPQIARSRGVTRQHIQALTDRLLASQLVRTQENPRDRRSPLLRLTEHGEAVVERMREREVTVLTEMGQALGDCDVEVALTTLDALQNYLDRKRAANGARRGA